MKSVRKRDGRLQEWNENRIVIAISKAVHATGAGDGELAQEIASMVTGVLESKFGENGVPTVEEIQDTVIVCIRSSGHYEVGEAYRLYRNERKRVRELSYILQTGDIIDNYVSRQTVTDADGEKDNANIKYSMQGLLMHLNSKVISPFWQMRIYTAKIRKAFLGYELHIHDLGFLGPYCMGWNLQDFLFEGFPRGVRGAIVSRPPKHFNTAMDQLQSAYFMLQNEAAGAEAVSNVDTLMAPYIFRDSLDEREVEQVVQGFINKMGQTTRIGSQCPFTNWTLDRTIPKFMREEMVVIGGVRTEFVYGDFQDEPDMFNRAFCKVMMEGDADGRVFSFPIPTYNITEDFDWDFPELWEMTAKFGVPYFSNFINSDMDPEDVRSMCCRLRLDNREIRRGGGFFGANPLTGSIGVVTINMPRIGYDSKDEDEYFEKLEYLMGVAKESLVLKRGALEEFMERGLYPNSKYWLRSVKEVTGGWWTNHFSTIGILGMNESCLNFLETPISTRQGHKFSVRIVKFMREILKEYQEEKLNSEGYPETIWNLEATPAEGTTYRFAKADKERFPKIIVANEKYLKGGASPFYTNSTHLPVDNDFGLGEALTHQEPLQELYTGGTVHHNFIGERNPSPKAIKSLVKKVCNSFKLPYYTMTPTFSVCPTHGYISGEFPTCPDCGMTCEVYSRIVGYLRPVENWNLGKQSEFAIRSTMGSLK